MTRLSFNFNIPGYQLVEELHRDDRIVVYRARSDDQQLGEDSRSVVIKLLLSEYPSNQELLSFRHQYAIMRCLVSANNLNLTGIVSPHSLEKYDWGYALIMEDFGGISLDRYAQQHQLALTDILNIAIQLADILHVIGLQRVVHKDIKPANILIHPVTKQVKLIDFSIAFLLPRETQEIVAPQQLEGTLAYLSPEQTGRMNRGIDYRTDFYALGVTLYELITGRLPFIAEDPIELINCHLTQNAIPIHLVSTKIPLVISQLITKLMAKNVEGRYQTALGIKHDLEQCLKQFQATKTITEFKLGHRDISDRFSIPEQLYGREPEVKVLLDAFARVSAGASELLLVAGHSGIGKTAVINEIHKPIVKQRGYFIKGKFDQFNRNLPFSAFVQAFRDLIGQLLSESDIQLAYWHSQILAAVGENGQVLIEVIPELVKIIGTQPPVSELSGTVAQQRFNWLFQKLIEVFTTSSHPLVIFLDDLQWADSASLQAIELLMRGNGYLLLLGAYRDNEVTPAHPLMLMLDQLQQANSVTSRITLAPLTFADTNRLIADTLHCEIDRAKPLTESIDLKAHGNPLFITQFLKALHTDGEIRFNPDGYWECDILKIQSLAITDDVVEFIAIQIQKLPTATQTVLKLAACIGAKFDLEVLSIVSEQSELVTMAVWNGLQAGLILPTSQIYKFYQDLEDLQDSQNCVAGADRVFQLPAANSTYCFLHDRVQQAAYSLIPESQRQQTHLQIGRLLLANTPAEQQSDRLFEMVNHFNIATRLIQQPAEREMVAALNLLAAQKARVATAYTAAVDYARIGIQLLGKLAWQQQYQLALALHETLAESTFLNGDLAQVPALVELVFTKATTPLDRVKAYETLIQLHTLQKQYRAAISQGLEILRQLGLKLAAKPNKLMLARALINTQADLLGKSQAKLVHLPEISAPEQVATLRILNHLLMPAFLCSQDLMVVFITSGIRLTLRHGNTSWAALFYSTYGIILASLGGFKQSYQMGKLATALNDRFDDQMVTSQVNGSVAWFCQPWGEPLHNSKPLMAECIKGCLASGNLTALGLSYCVDIFIDLNLGVSLDQISSKIAIAESIVKQTPDYSQQLLAITYHSVKNLQNISTQPALLADTSEAEVALIDRLKSNREDSALSTIYAWKTWLSFIFEDIPHALIYADAQLPYEFADSNCYSITTLWMYDALTRLAAYPHSDSPKGTLRERRVQKQLLDRVKSTQRKLLKCARLMPANFQHKYDLVEAEKYRVLGNFSKAIELYDRAITGAKTHNFPNEEALANELTAKFYLQWGKEKIAAVYMQSAYYFYLRWGAKAKTAQLEQKYPQLLTPILHARQTEFHPLVTLAKITDSADKNRLNNQGVNFDLASVIQSAQFLSSTIDLGELIKQLSQIILRNSGAESCILALSDLQDQWQISRSSFINQELITTQLPQTIVNSIEYPANLIYWIKNTQRSIIFDARQPLDIPDLYLLEHQPQSVFCLPIVKQEKVLGVLYLEHRHTPDIFTNNKKTVVTFLCNQAAIALQNAQLYQESQQAAENIRLQQRDLESTLFALQQSEQRHQNLSDNIPGAIYRLQRTVDRRITCPYISSGCYALFQLSPAAVMADCSCLINLIHADHLSDFRRAAAESAQSMTPKLWEGKVTLASGEVKWIKCISRPQLQPDGSIIWDGVMLDITEQQVALQERQQTQLDLSLTNKQLKLTIQELHQATRLKDEFLATMSHELRTPLNAILGMSESLQEEIFGAINARQLNAILTIEQSGQHLLALINDVLDVSKISAGKLELHIRPVNIAELCRSSLILVRQQALEKQIQIDTHLSADLDQILVDERRLRQVLINLLSNAIKFTAPGGQVVLSVAVTAPGVSHYPAEYSVCLAVSDTGIGIASTDLPKLFQPFIQIDSNLNRKYDGTGLGLVLVKQIVELHGGYVTINSEVGKGSCFSVVLPQTDMKPSEPSSKSTNSEQHYSHRQSIGNTSSALPPHTSPLVLLAEDNEININTLSSYLTAKGYRIILAQNGHEAISLNQTYHPDLILMDIQMPEMDGIVAIEHIRQHSQPKNIPIIALTALAMDGDREKCLAVGANRYLSKPFKLQELHNTIQECLNMN
jgi:predicted ATPase/signal transduction histidine kinase/CheY-like chemotaxis protein/GAF domain-containing protein